jgi:prepilin-type N-terminal cleavage/methylation domain-containing protein
MKSGFTLPEVALALVVAGLLLAIALPGFTALKQ